MRPHLKTFGPSAEKWDSSGRSFVAEKVKPSRFQPSEVALPRDRSQSRSQLEPRVYSHSPKPEPTEIRPRGKRILPRHQVLVKTLSFEEAMGRHRHVYDASGCDVRQQRSVSYTLENSMAHKGAADVRSLESCAGLPGYCVQPAEYSSFLGTQYFALDGVVARPKMRPSRGERQLRELQAAGDRAAKFGSRSKPFAEKREDEIRAAEVASVAVLPYSSEEES